MLTITRLQTTDPNFAEDLDSETDLNTTVATSVTIARNVRAVIDGGEGTLTFGAGGQKERVVYKFRADPIPGDIIISNDTLTDALGQVYLVDWCRRRYVFGMAFLEGECYQEPGEE